jgi:tetratricopeptide (TPR) repeat protein
MLIIIVQGLADNLVYGRWGAALVFFLPGVAYAVGYSSARDNAQASVDGPAALRFLKRSRYQRLMMVAAAVACAAVLIVVYAYRQPLLAAWYADLGAVEMAKIQLAGFVPGGRAGDYDVAELEGAERLFKQALRHDSGNRTANHRLGLIASDWRDFSAAVSYLEAALRADQNHRGIRKALGFNYVWSGQLDQAMPLLVDIEEARTHIGWYAWWWGTQDRDDLAERSAAMEERLGAAEPPP